MTTAASLALLAALELDAVLVAQTMISRPLVVGSLLGALSGDAISGAMFGAVFELLSLCDLPVGGCLTWSAPVSAGTAVVLAGRGVSFPLCFAGGLAAGLLHARAEKLERARRAATGDALARRAEAGGSALGRALGFSIAAHAGMTIAVAGLAVAAFSAADRGFLGAPPLVRNAAAFIVSSSPWIGLSGVAAWGLRRA